MNKLLRSIIPRNMSFVYKFLKVIFFSSFLTLTGCSALSMLGGGGVPSLGVEATLGDKEESIVGSIGDTQQLSVERLTGGVVTNNVEQVPLHFMILMILGWLMPTPTEIFKSTKDFILKLFGRRVSNE